MEISKKYHRIKEAGEERPKGGELAAYGGIDEIKTLLQGTGGFGGVDPKAVEAAGVAYVDAGGLLAESYLAIEDLAVELSKHWKGKDAVGPQKALQLLHATTRELANRANHIGRPLEWFGRDILSWYKENAVGHGAVSWDDDINLLVPGVEWDWNTHPHTKKAREHLDALNARMGELYDLLPEGVEKELPNIKPDEIIANVGPSPVKPSPTSDLLKGLKGNGFDGLAGNNGDLGGANLTGGGPPVNNPDLTGGGPPGSAGLPGYPGGPAGAGNQGATPGSPIPSGVDGADFPGAATPGADAPGPNGAGSDPGMGKMPDNSSLDALNRANGPNMDDMDSTDLAAYQPPGGYQPPGNLQLPGGGVQDFESTRMPSGNGAANSPSTSMGPGAVGPYTGTGGPYTGTGGPYTNAGGSYTNAGGAASAANVSAARASGMPGGMPGGMPFLPGGMSPPGGGENGEDVSASNWVKEEDDVWGGGEGYVQVDGQGRLA